MAAWRKRDPIRHWRERLVKAGLLTEQEAEQLERDQEKQIGEAIEFAKASPFPDPSAAWEDVYAG